LKKKENKLEKKFLEELIKESMKLKELLDKIKEWLKKPAKISELHMKKLKNL